MKRMCMQNTDVNMNAILDVKPWINRACRLTGERRLEGSYDGKICPNG